MFVERRATVALSAESTINTLKVSSKARNTMIDSKGKINLLDVDADNVLLNEKAVSRGQYKDSTTPETGQSEQPNAAAPGTSNGGNNSSTGGGGSSNSGGTTPSVPGNPSGENRFLQRRFQMSIGKWSGMMNSMGLP